MFSTNTYDIPFDQGGERFFVRDSFNRHNRKTQQTEKERRSFLQGLRKVFGQ